MIKEIFLHKLTRLQQTLQSRFVLDRAPTVVKIKNKKIKKGQKKQKGNDKRNAAAQDTAAPNAAVAGGSRSCPRGNFGLAETRARGAAKIPELWEMRPGRGRGGKRREVPWHRSTFMDHEALLREAADDLADPWRSFASQPRLPRPRRHRAA